MSSALTQRVFPVELYPIHLAKTLKKIIVALSETVHLMNEIDKIKIK